MSSKDHLPFRKNCEGYFIDNKSNILAQESCHGHLIFPGGGIEANESPEEAILRETFEETGASIEKDIKKLGIIEFVWGNEWAKTEKQKERFQQFKGEEMHFFSGKICQLELYNNNNEDIWKGKKLMPIAKAINLIENESFNDDIKEYRKFQLKCLKELLP